MRKNYNIILEHRISRLEKLIKNEKAFGAGGVHSNAYQVWQFLMKNGPSYPADVKDFFPSNKRATIASTITNCLNQDCLFRKGSKLVANPDYDWDDISSKSLDVAPAIEPVKKPEPEDDMQEPEVVAPVQPVLAQEPNRPANRNGFTSSNLCKAIIKVLGTAKNKSAFYDQLESGFTALEAIDSLESTKRDKLASEFKTRYEKIRRAIIAFGVKKFTKILFLELKRNGVKPTSYDIPEETDDDWEEYHDEEDGYNNKSFDYYNDDDLTRW